MNKHLILCIVCVCFLLVFTQKGVYGTEISGNIVDQVWNVDDSPVRVTGDLYVASLTIMPGVMVEFTGNYRVTVNGVLRVAGTTESPVILRPARNIESWKGIYFEKTIPGSEFEWCHFVGAQETAVRLIQSNPTFQNCTFNKNKSPDYGGAIYANLTDGDLVVTDCKFEENHAQIGGGAICAVLERGTIFAENCTFTENVANPDYQTHHSSGGAVWIDGNSSFCRSTFNSNQVHTYTIYAAAGIYATGGALSTGRGHCEIAACTFIGNSCEMTAHQSTPDTSFAFGGAVRLYSGSMMLQNCVLAENNLSAQRRRIYKGSALSVNEGDCLIMNSTFASNSGHSAIHNDAGRICLINSILYLNYDHVTQISGPVTVSYSDIQGGFDGVGVIDSNPIFDSDYRILPGSPAIDAGHPDSEYNDTHFPPSLGGDRNDMGYLVLQRYKGSSKPKRLADDTPVNDHFSGGYRHGRQNDYENQTGIDSIPAPV
ncbi:hypothetical protein ACFL5F_01390 [Planctomycetota bacterium]